MNEKERREGAKSKLLEIQVLTITGILVMLTQTPSSTAKWLFLISIAFLTVGSMAVAYSAWLENRTDNPEGWCWLNKFFWYHYSDAAYLLYIFAVFLIPFAALTTIYGAQLRQGLNQTWKTFYDTANCISNCT